MRSIEFMSDKTVGYCINQQRDYFYVIKNLTSGGYVGQGYRTARSLTDARKFGFTYAAKNCLNWKTRYGNKNKFKIVKISFKVMEEEEV